MKMTDVKMTAHALDRFRGMAVTAGEVVACIEDPDKIQMSSHYDNAFVYVRDRLAIPVSTKRDADGKRSVLTIMYAHADDIDFDSQFEPLHGRAGKRMRVFQ